MRGSSDSSFRPIPASLQEWSSRAPSRSGRGKPLAGKNTLNRIELTRNAGPKGRYRKIAADPAGMDALLIEVFLAVDVTDDP